MSLRNVSVFMIGAFLLSCSPQRLVIRQLEPVLDNSVKALYEEGDLQLAEQAMAADLKLVEGLLKSDPQNEKLLTIAAQGYAGYAMGFVEDKQPQRAKKLYLRARDYGLRLLFDDDSIEAHLNKPINQFESLIAQKKEDELPGLFWSGFAWGGYLNLSLNEPTALIDFPKVQAIMKRVATLQPDYFYGGVYLFLGAVYGMKPRMLGGNPEKALQYFQKNLQMTGEQFLLTYIYMARYYAAKVLDEEKFDNYIQQIESASEDILPEARLLNAIAKKKARLLKEKKSDIF
ncbi:MAG: hypothetical protein GF313_17510 [Caldithrix sp.]|nr:hypothetical protein [Caldithrix sp.]